MKVYVIGCGMGNPDTLTVGAARVIERADVIIGAARLVEEYRDGTREVLELVRAADIEQALRKRAEAEAGVETSAEADVGADAVCAVRCRSAAVLMSGDAGFYSGAAGLLRRLEGFEVEVVAGISSVAYFCAKLQVPWQDAHMVSAHGRECDVAGEVQCHRKTFALTGGATKAQDVCCDLVRRGLGEVHVAVGEHLSYPDERIVCGTARELAEAQFSDLSVMLVENDRPVGRALAAPCLVDDDFERGEVPMTKQEVRHLAVCKLGLSRDAVVWDVGAGTGSISCEAALAACAGEVYAVERNAEACGLIERNARALGASNVRVVRGAAPDALAGLPAPTHLVVGGSGGHLREILACALGANPTVRVVVCAVTLETLSEMLECLRELPLAESDICQVQISRARVAGRYHLMSANNPVYLVSAVGAGGGARTGTAVCADVQADAAAAGKGATR